MKGGDRIGGQLACLLSSRVPKEGLGNRACGNGDRSLLPVITHFLAEGIRLISLFVIPRKASYPYFKTSVVRILCTQTPLHKRNISTTCRRTLPSGLTPSFLSKNGNTLQPLAVELLLWFQCPSRRV